MDFIIAQISNWTPKRYNYKFQCVKIIPSNSIGMSNSHECLNDLESFIELPDKNWKKIR